MMHPKIYKAIEEIDAQLFCAFSEHEDLLLLEDYINRWGRKIQDLKEKT